MLKGSARLSMLAVCSLLLGILGFAVFLLIPVAIITGAIASRKIKHSSGSLRGRPAAITGIIAGFAALVFAAFVIIGNELSYRSFKVPTDSMAPAIKAKERILVDLKAYDLKKPLRGDVVVYELLSNGKRRLMCKRVVGLPGEEVEIRSGEVFIDSAPTHIPNLPAGVIYFNGGNFGKTGEPFKVPGGTYYVLGDNPADSFDSRQHGAVDKKDIKGRYLFSYKGLLK